MKIFLSAFMAVLLTACAVNPTTRVSVEPSPVPALVTAPVVTAPATVSPEPQVVRDHQAMDALIADILNAGQPPRPSITYTSRDVECMALNMYHEARGEGAQGMIAVGYVVLNRAASDQFRPKTACGIIYQQLVRGSCQFAWTCDTHPDYPRETAAMQQARELAVRVLEGEVPNPIGESKYYVEKRIGVPSWARRLQVHSIIGNHRFFV